MYHYDEEIGIKCDICRQVTEWGERVYIEDYVYCFECMEVYTKEEKEKLEVKQ